MGVEPASLPDGTAPSRLKPEGPVPSFVARRYEVGCWLVIEAAGDVDLCTVPVLEDLVDGSSHTVFDMSLVTFLDARGLGLFAATRNKLNGSHGAVRVAGPSAQARKVLTLTALDDYVEVYDSLGDALSGHASCPGPLRRGEYSSSTALTALLSSASDVLSTSLAPEDAVRSFARLVVPALADWSVITLVDPEGRPRDVESWHRDPSKRALTARFAEHRLAGRTAPEGSLATLMSGAPFVLSAGAMEFTGRTLRSAAAAEALDGLELESIAVLPMLIEDRVVGLITLARGPGRPPMSDGELDATIDLCRRASITLANARSFERQRGMSEMLQESMLTEPVQPDGFEVVVRYQPAGEAAQVGGDWYDAFRQRSGETVLVVGDVVGHDLAAAAVMGQLRPLVRGIGVTTGSGPARLLTDVDRAIESLYLDTSATVAAVRIERGDGDPSPAQPGARLTYSNAGHPPPVLIGPDGVCVLLDEHDLLLGVLPDAARHEHVVHLGSGSSLLMYTDGLIERRYEHHDHSIAKLSARLSELHSLPLPTLVDQLIKIQVPDSHDDDVAVLAVRLR